MQNIVDVQYSQTGQSKSTNQYGMREMQARAFESRDVQYLLIKSPPASGKSRALMFLGLDKLENQGVKKVIVAVPERSIGSSFAPTDLKKFGFFADWNPKDKYNLCTPGSEGSTSKVKAFREFLESDEKILICTHATFRFACEGLEENTFDNILIAIDEFHHVSADAENKLGDILREIITKSTAHIVAMTGSYFRGDSIPVLRAEDEEKFTKVTYNYYEQLNGYEYLKSLGIGYHFYQGRYTEAIMEILDTDKKTILHIPNVNSGESTKRKHEEVDFIIDAIGEFISQDKKTGVITVKRKNDGKIIKIADLVQDESKERDKIVGYLREIKSIDDMDIIIALGMAKEGFDWPYCEHALTVGYRGSLTEIIQIIGRATRDSENKSHAQFTNLIAQPDAEDDLVKTSVNNMLKAITASLLMEQVLAPNWKFKTKVDENDKPKPGEIKIRGLKTPSSKRVKDILATDIVDLQAVVLQDDKIRQAMMGNVDAEVMNKVMIADVIREKYPDLDEDQVEEVRQYLVLESVVKNNKIVDIKSIKSAIIENVEIQLALKNNQNPDEIRADLLPKVIKNIYPDLNENETKTFCEMINKIPNAADANKLVEGDKRFIRMAGSFVDLDDLHIDLIDKVNPFQKAFEVLSKSVNTKVLKVIQDHIAASRIKMTVQEAGILWPKVKEFHAAYGRLPDSSSNDPQEVRMAECVIYLRELNRKRASQNG